MDDIAVPALADGDSPASGQVDVLATDLEQARALEMYLSELRQQALVLDYASEAELQRHIDAILTAAVSRDAGRVEVQKEHLPAEALGGADVWPSVDTSERVSSDNRGKIRTSRSWYLVLTNTGSEVARNVTIEIQAVGEGDPHWQVLQDNDEKIEPSHLKAGICASLSLSAWAAQPWCERWSDGKTAGGRRRTSRPCGCDPHLQHCARRAKCPVSGIRTASGIKAVA